MRSKNEKANVIKTKIKPKNSQYKDLGVVATGRAREYLIFWSLFIYDLSRLWYRE